MLINSFKLNKKFFSEKYYFATFEKENKILKYNLRFILIMLAQQGHILELELSCIGGGIKQSRWNVLWHSQHRNKESSLSCSPQNPQDDISVWMFESDSDSYNQGISGQFTNI